MTSLTTSSIFLPQARFLPRKALVFRGFYGKTDPARAGGGLDSAIRESLRAKDLNHRSAFFRDWQIFPFLARHLGKHFPQGLPVYSIGCSVGMEPYSLAMVLDQQLGTNQACRYPITAVDLEPAVIELAQSGIFLLGDKDRDFKRAQQAGIANPERYLLPVTEPGEKETRRSAYCDILRRHEFRLESDRPLSDVYRIHPDLKPRVTFEAGDARDVIRRISRTAPCMVSMRNFLYHLPTAAQKDFVHTLATRLAPGSIVTLGSWDLKTSAPRLLAQAGFSAIAKDDAGPCGKLLFQKN